MIRASLGSQQIRTLDSSLNPQRVYLDAAGERFKKQALAEQPAELRHYLLRRLREEEILEAERAKERLQLWQRDKKMTPRPEPYGGVESEKYEREIHKIKADRLMIDVPRKMKGGTGIGIPRWDKPNTLMGLEANWDKIGRKEANKHRAKNFCYEYPKRGLLPEPLPASLLWKYTQLLGELDGEVYRPGVEPSWKCAHGHGDYTDDRGIPYCTGCQPARLTLPPRPRLFTEYAGLILKVIKERGFRARIPEFREDLVAAVEAHLWETREEIETIEVLRGQGFAGVCVKKKVEQYLEQVQARGKDIYTPGRWPAGGGRRVIQGADGKELPWSQLMVGPDGKLAEQDGSRRHTKALGTWDEANAEYEGEKAGEIATLYEPTEIIVTEEVHPRNDFAGLVNPAAFTPPTTAADVVNILAKLPAVHRQVVVSRHGESDSGRPRTWAEVELHTGVPERTARRYYDDARTHMRELAGVE